MHVFAAELAVAECDAAVGKCKERVVLADADIAARVPLGAALAHDDVAGEDSLSAELLHAEALALTVAAVAGRAACFLMCHVELLRLRTLLRGALSRCSIFCRPGFSLGLGGSRLLGRAFGTARRFLVVGSGVFGRRSGDRASLVLSSRRFGSFLRTCSRGFAAFGLGRRFGLGRSFLLLLLVADRDDLQDREIGRA